MTNSSDNEAARDVAGDNSMAPGGELVHLNALPVGFRLRNWVIEKEMGSSGFEISYLARHEKDIHRRSVIREYLPLGIAVRAKNQSVELVLPSDREIFEWGRTRYIQQAQALARLDHPNIVRVENYFELGNTVYIVMEYVRARTLDDVVRKDGPLNNSRLTNLISVLMTTLDLVHNELLHHAITPSNILVRADDSPVLIDFGTAREATRARDALDADGPKLSIVYNAGFVPIEQIEGTENGPWTDIYALGACFYFAAFGEVPTDVADRAEALYGDQDKPARDLLVNAMRRGQSDFSPELMNVIDRALRFEASRRPGNVAEWRANLSEKELPLESQNIGPAKAMTDVPTEPEESSRDGASGTIAWLLGGVGIAAALFLAWMKFGHIFMGLDEPHPKTIATPSASEPEAVEAPQSTDITKAIEKFEARNENAKTDTIDHVVEETPVLAVEPILPDSAPDGETSIESFGELTSVPGIESDAQPLTPQDSEAINSSVGASDEALSDTSSLFAPSATVVSADSADELNVAVAPDTTPEIELGEDVLISTTDVVGVVDAVEQTGQKSLIAEQATNAEQQGSYIDQLLSDADEFLQRNITDVSKLEEARQQYREIIRADPDNVRARGNLESIDLIQRLHAAIQKSDASIAQSALAAARESFRDNGHPVSLLEPLANDVNATQERNLIQKYLLATTGTSPLKDVDEALSKEHLDQLADLGIDVSRIDAAKNGVQYLRDFEKSLDGKNHTQASADLISAEVAFAEFSGGEVSLSAAHNRYAQGLLQAQKQRNAEFNAALTSATDLLRRRPVNQTMLVTAVSAYEGLMTQRPGRLQTRQVLDNLRKIQNVLTHLRQENLEKARSTVAEIELSPTSGIEERVLLTDVEGIVIASSIDESMGQFADAIAISPMTEATLDGAESVLKQATEIDNANNDRIRSAYDILSQLRLAYQALNDEQFEVVDARLNDAGVKMSRAGLDQTGLDHMDQQLTQAIERFEQRKRDSQIDALVQSAHRALEVAPLENETLDLVSANCAKMLDLDPGSLHAAPLLNVITLIGEAGNARDDLRIDDTLKTFDAIKSRFVEFGLKVDAIEEAHDALLAEQDLATDIEILKLFESALEKVQNAPFDAIAQDIARIDVDRIETLRPGEPIANVGRIVLDELAKAAGAIDNQSFVDARQSVTRAKAALAKYDLDGVLDVALAEIQEKEQNSSQDAPPAPAAHVPASEKQQRISVNPESVVWSQQSAAQ